MQREIKIWGERWLIRKDSSHAVSYLKVKRGYRCSWHRHQTKFNLFVVLHGKITIIVKELGERKVITLGPGESFTVRPGQWHEFRGADDAEVIEHMYVEYSEEDIEREVIGSRIND